MLFRRTSSHLEGVGDEELSWGCPEFECGNSCSEANLVMTSGADCHLFHLGDEMSLTREAIRVVTKTGEHDCVISEDKSCPAEIFMVSRVVPADVALYVDVNMSQSAGEGTGLTIASLKACGSSNDLQKTAFSN